MLFNSLAFALFFPVVWVGVRLLPHVWQNRFLLLASYFFYGSWDWRFLSLIAISTGVDFFCGRRIHEAQGADRKKYLLLSLATNLGLLGTFKYFDFFAESFAALLAGVGLTVSPFTLDVILPVGISFYTFQTLSYTIDIYRRQLEPESQLERFALFVAFFPQLVAGPIERARDLLPQIRTPRSIDRDCLARGSWFVCWGFFLKIFVADNLAVMVDGVFGAVGPQEGGFVLVGVYAFAFQIFGDFAGYSSIAIGISLLMGFRLSTNFRFPYFVTDPRAFWRHWHISLSSWLRDYLYIPLGGNRHGKAQRNLMITMLLGGLWHGAGWTFVLWGAFHGIWLALHRQLKKPIPGAALKLVVTFHLTCLGWLLFRAESVGQVGEMLGALTTIVARPSADLLSAVLQIVFYSWLMLAIQWLQFRNGKLVGIEGIPVRLRLPILLAMVYSTIVWGRFGGGEFIYFQF